MMEKTIFDMITAPWKARVIFAAVRLHLFTLLSNKTLGTEEIAETLNAVPLLLRAILDACVSMKLLDYQNGKYKNSSLSEKFLVEGKQDYLGDLIQIQDDESVHWDKLINLVLGRQERRSEEDRYRTFVKGMDNLGNLGEARALVEAVNLSGCQKMIDAGGGSGVYSLVFCREYPRLRSTLVDRRETLDIAREMLDPYTEKERIILKEADLMKDFFDAGVDVFLLSDLIYDEAAAKVVLKKARDCLNENGILVIRGYYSDPEKIKPLFGALFAIGQLVFDCSRKVMTVSDLQREVKEAGFDIEKVSPLTEISFLLLAKKSK